MASRDEIARSALVIPLPRQRSPGVGLTQVPIPRPRRSGLLNFARTSLRIQTVALFMLLVVFATSAMVTASIVGRASDYTQAQQVQLITWRYDTALLSLAAQELRTNLAQMNNSLLGGDAQGAKSYQTLAETNIQFIDSEISLISELNLPSDAAAVTTQDADAFQALTTFARRFIAAGPHTDQEMLAQVDGAFTTWRAARAPVDTFIATRIQDNQALNDARKAYVNDVTLVAGIGTALLFVVLAFYQFGLTLRPVVQLVDVATKLAAGEPATIRPTRRRDELGRLTTALAAWQQNSQDLFNGLRDGSSQAAASAFDLSSASEQLAAATAE
jgi:HAMP domain-containing protein